MLSVKRLLAAERGRGHANLRINLPRPGLVGGDDALRVALVLGRHDSGARSRFELRLV